ncbi:LacI family DNA-binding transcriptional regulator [Pleomorphovibrio marinus]|uniref:LacI family DNA-binding transcriptional regulator n=1 Tax=Pleomorphovibrio marinus TaxID=2164132 RepID=UPI000E0BE03C|nr:LacI family DNA-binding transcriptional regulator [Pleomorphovibrio marinus]
MKKPITIKDIAEKLNVSVATVSRALRNSPEIKKETKQAVLKMAKELDYHPNLLASSLSSKKSRILGVVVPTINRFFWSNSIAGIEKVAYQEGYKVMIFQSGESFQKEVEIVETLANSRVDGIILALSKETSDYNHLKDVMNRGIPLLLFERVCQEITTSKIQTDDFAGAMEIVNHLVSKGRRRIAYMGGPLTLGVCQERLGGYRKALQTNNLEGFEVELEDFSYEIAGKAFRELWNQKTKPDALFCFADILAIGALNAAQRMQIKVPEELAIVGFGDDVTGRYISPSITTMAQPSFEMGEMAANTLLEIISGDQEKCIPKLEIVKPTLIVRESS